MYDLDFDLIIKSLSYSGVHLVLRKQLPNCYLIMVISPNTLDSETQSLSLNYINQTNQNIFNLIMKLHNKFGLISK